MDHFIRNFDWCNMQDETNNFVDEKDIDNCVIERILRGTFTDPLLSSSDSDEEPVEIDWKKMKKLDTSKKLSFKYFVAGLKPIFYSPKLSALTIQQHVKILKILSKENPEVLKCLNLGKPNCNRQVYEEIMKIYQTEQKEFQQWAKTLWATAHSAYAIKPKKIIEDYYDAKIKKHMHKIISMPKHYELAAQIPLETCNSSYELLHQEDLFKVNFRQLPKAQIKELDEKFVIIPENPRLPEVCIRHPCNLILPNEHSVTVLPLREVQQVLAQYAADNATQYIIREEAIKCLVQHDNSWMIPVTVRQVVGLDGEMKNVCVIGDEVWNQKKPARTRAYMVFKDLLEQAMVTPQERSNIELARGDKSQTTHSKKNASHTNEIMDLSSEDEENELVIDIDIEDFAKIPKHSNIIKSAPGRDIDKMFTCNNEDCNDLNLRSYRKWRIANKTDMKHLNVIIHCAHKTRGEDSELILEPILEYQLSLGATCQSHDKLRSLAVAMYLRNNPTLLNVRLDGISGEVVRYHFYDLRDFLAEHGQNLIDEATSILYNALNQLQGLLPGDYILQHELNHGSNVLLYVARSMDSKAPSIDFKEQITELTEEEEKEHLKIPPTLGPTLLPYHKFRRTLPLAFTPFSGSTRVSQKPAKATVVASKAARKRKRKGKKKKH